MSASRAVAVDAPALQPLAREAFARPTPEVARSLLGAWIVSESPDGLTAVRVVEAEAYGGPEDLASHARAGLTRRTAPMFGPPGHAYVYLVYGLHHCLNVVAENRGRAGAVLVRAGEPVLGAELMRKRRGRPTDPDHRLAAGPARLCQALAIDRSLDGHDVTQARGLWVAVGGDALQREEVAVGQRVGVDYAGDWSARPWRFWLRGHPSVSRR